MKITVKDCDLKICEELNTWLNNKDIVKHAMFDQTFTDEFIYYKNKKDELEEIVSIVVIYIDEVLMGYAVLMYFEENEVSYVEINPIIINPKYHNKGFGKKILNYIICNIESVINEKVDLLSSSISIINEPSIRLFTSLGFKQIGASEDNTYIYYELKV